VELKRYQEKVTEDLQAYLREVNKFGPKISFISSTSRAYNETYFQEIPFVCIKIPTGGGKTLVATHAVTKIMETTLQRDRGIVMWFVPSEAIKTQTLDKLKNKNDFHRQILDEYFNNKVVIMSNTESLRLKKHDVEENICIIISSLDAFRKDKQKRGNYKVYQENGELLPFFENINDDSKLDKEDGSVTNTLANVVKLSNPLILIDEGHRAQTLLSIEFIKDLNPSFILEFTATPREGSNILVDIHSSQLKEENMVKIPIYLESVSYWQEAVRHGVTERNNLEKITKKLKSEYIRPIALLQAEQEKEDPKRITVGKIKEFLIKEMKVPEEEIAIKTSKQNQIQGINLLSKKCKIRYIITVSALAEGWDCPFAYVLISVANVGAKVSVEQIIGRIVRLPYVKKKKEEELNNSYIFASAKNFNEAAKQVVTGLEKNGFNKADLINKKNTKEKYEFEIEKTVRETLKVPYVSFEKDPLQFGDLVGEEFKLSKQDPKFKFETHFDSDGKIKLDIKDEDEWVWSRQTTLNLVYKDKNFSEEELVQWLDRKVRVNEIDKIDKVNFIKKVVNHQLRELKDYSLAELSVNRFILRDKLDKIIKEQIENHTKMIFDKLLQKGKIKLDTQYVFPDKIMLSERSEQQFKKNYYADVEKLNKEEMTFVSRLDTEELSNVKYWVRNREKKDWFIQGWKKNKFYPDFVAVTKTGNLLALEWKGGDRVSNEDTKYKENLAKIWEKLGKNKLKFYLVHNDNIEAVLTSIKKD